MKSQDSGSAPPSADNAYAYFAFISYSRKDSRVAAWLQRKLEWYRFPVNLVSAENRPLHATRLRPIMRDKTDLEVDSNSFWDNIKLKIDRSRFLIVLCSPKSARSVYVNREIQHFFRNPNRKRAIDCLIPVIVSGSPGSGDASECLPTILHKVKERILARNLPSMIPDEGESRTQGWEAGFLSTVACLLRVDRAKLADRYRQAKRRQIRQILASTCALLLTFAGITAWAVFAERRAADERIQKETARQEADANMKLAQRQRALSLVDRGVKELERGDHARGFAILLQAYREAGDIPDVRASVRSLIGFWDAALPRLLKHGGVIQSAAFSPDGSKIATASDDKTVHLWDAVTGQPLGEPMKHGEAAVAVAYCPDGKTIATATKDGTARFWSATTGRPIGEPMKHGRWPLAVAFSPDGRRFATASKDGTARLWGAGDGSPRGEVMKHDGAVNAMSFSPDGEKIATAGDDGKVRLWDASSGRLLGTPLEHDAAVYCVNFSPDGAKIGTGSRDETARQWDVSSGQPLGARMEHQDGVYGVAFSPDGTKLATASWDKTARLWDATTGKPIGPPMNHDERVSAVVFSPDGTRLATASRDKTARLWDAATCKPVGAPIAHSVEVTDVKFSPDGTRLAIVSAGDTVRIWNTTGIPMALALKEAEPATMTAVGPNGSTITKPLYLTSAVGFSPDGTTVATLDSRYTDKGTYNEVHIWDVATGKPQGVPIEHDYRARSLTFSPDGKKIVARYGRAARIWDVFSGKPLGAPMEHLDTIEDVVCSPDGTKVATASSDKTARLWDVATCRPLGAAMQHGDRVTAVAFSPDGTKVATASNDKTIRLWDAATGQPSGAPMQHDASVRFLAFSPDGTKIATVADDKTARFWDVASSQPIGAAMKHDGAIRAMSFSPDGMLLATASMDRTARVWDAATGKPMGEPIIHDRPVFAVRFSSDGRRLVIGCERGARLWDVATLRPLGETIQGEFHVFAVAFSPNGKMFATGGDAGARIWRVPQEVPDDPDWLNAYVAAVSQWDVDAGAKGSAISAEDIVAKWQIILGRPDWLNGRKAVIERGNLIMHDSEARRLATTHNWFAAAFHLRQLCNRDPANPDLQRRLAEVGQKSAGAANRTDNAPDPATAEETEVQLRLLHLAYYSRTIDGGSPPSGPQELATFFESNPHDAASLERVKNGRFAVVWNESRIGRDDGEHAVLIYEKDAGNRGGMVCFADGDVRRLSAVELNVALHGGASKERTDLKAVIRDGVRLLEAKRYKQFLLKFLRPHDVKRMLDQPSVDQQIGAKTDLKQSVDDFVREWTTMCSDFVLQSFRAAAEREPVFSKSGKLATFDLSNVTFPPRFSKNKQLRFERFGMRWCVLN